MVEIQPKSLFLALWKPFRWVEMSCDSCAIALCKMGLHFQGAQTMKLKEQTRFGRRNHFYLYKSGICLGSRSQMSLSQKSASAHNLVTPGSSRFQARSELSRSDQSDEKRPILVSFDPRTSVNRSERAWEHGSRSHEIVCGRPIFETMA